MNIRSLWCIVWMRRREISFCAVFMIVVLFLTACGRAAPTAPASNVPEAGQQRGPMSLQEGVLIPSVRYRTITDEERRLFAAREEKRALQREGAGPDPLFNIPRRKRYEAYDYQHLYDLILDAGWPKREQLNVFKRVICESSGDRAAVNRDWRGRRYLGLLQMWEGHGPRLGFTSHVELLDAYNNLYYAHQLWQLEGWSPWTESDHCFRYGPTMENRRRSWDLLASIDL